MMSILDAALPNLPQGTVFRFNERPALLSANDRLSYRTATLLLSLSYCAKSKSTFARLALLNFSVRSQKLRTALARVVRGFSDPIDVVVRFDPFFPRVLTLAVANELIYQDHKGTHFLLASRGRRIVDRINENGFFGVERDFFDDVANGMTETAVVKILSGIDL